jgi:predicted ribosomally synthesized peptide with SipW-like signal peptide
LSSGPDALVERHLTLPDDSEGRHKDVKNNKLLLSGLVVVGAAAVIGAGTFATFNAQTTNPNNTFANGTLVLSNTKSGGSACLSTGAGTNTDTNVNGSCDTLFSLSVKKPGDSATASLTIKNEGSLDASALKVFSASCADANATGETYNGSGLPCSKVQLYIQQWSDSGFTTPSQCVYGGATVAGTCDFSDSTKTLTAFTTSYSSAGSAKTVGTLSSHASNYFTIGLKLPSDADNTYQGRQASFDLSWYANQ